MKTMGDNEAQEQTLCVPSSSICFNAFELQYLCMVAERRNCGKQPNGVKNRRYDYQNDFSLNFHGAMGEYAVAKFLKLKIDHSVALQGDDKVADLWLGKTSIQVKTNMARWKTCYLYFNSLALFRADIAVLCLIKSATEVALAGWIERDAFKPIAQSIDFGYGERFCVGLKSLRPMSALLCKAAT